MQSDLSKQLYAKEIKAKARSPIERSQKIAGFVFALPWIVGLLIFYLIPMAVSLYWSFTDYSILSLGKFLGFKNYQELFHDSAFLKSMIVTFYYTCLFVPLSIVIGVGVSLLLNIKIKGQSIFRTALFIPNLVPVIAMMIIWNWLLNPQLGIINWLLGIIHIPAPGWFSSEHWAMPALTMISLWASVGGSTVIYLAGLQDVPPELYEAADVDGANVFHKTWHITLPLLTPVIFFQLIMGIIGALQQFNLPFLITGGTGQPNNALLFFGMNLYSTAFSYLKMGYASAMAWVMFIVIIIITLVLFKVQNKWVFYQGKKE